MRRRDLIALITGSTVTSPMVAWAQTTEKRRRIAFVHSGIPIDKLTETGGPDWVRRFFEELRRLGHVEGPNFVVERYSAEGRSDRYADLAQLVVRTAPDAIVMNSSEFTRVFTKATSTIPIVAITSDPIETGLVSSLSRPGGNLTGVSIDAGAGIMTKRLEILKEALPGVARIAFLMRSTRNDTEGSSLRDVGQSLGIATTVIRPAQINEVQLRSAFADIARQRFDAVIIDTQGSFLANRATIVALAEFHRLPVMYPYRDFVDLGGLLAYAPDLGELARRIASDVHQILTGTSPGDIPYFLPTKFELVINLKAAKSLGIALSPITLARADEVIE